jgi:hypothetical protein
MKEYATAQINPSDNENNKTSCNGLDPDKILDMNIATMMISDMTTIIMYLNVSEPSACGLLEAKYKTAPQILTNSNRLTDLNNVFLYSASTDNFVTNVFTFSFIADKKSTTDIIIFIILLTILHAENIFGLD